MLELAPSEVRKMTLGEIHAVIAAKTRAAGGDRVHGSLTKDDLDELYEDLQEAKARYAECQ